MAAAERTRSDPGFIPCACAALALATSAGAAETAFERGTSSKATFTLDGRELRVALKASLGVRPGKEIIFVCGLANGMPLSASRPIRYPSSEPRAFDVQLARDVSGLVGLCRIDAAGRPGGTVAKALMR